MTEIAPSISQSLLLQVIEQLSGVDQRIGVLQGQANEIIKEQGRAADGRKEIYEKLGVIPALQARLDRIEPLVDRHEGIHKYSAGAVSFGKTVWLTFAGAFGALLAMVAQWAVGLLSGIKPH
jgi:hypothetical protein